ncbi:MAG: hypothetical protein QOG87_1916 [Actinomycetota bacterium]
MPQKAMPQKTERNHLVALAAALLAIQVIHGAIPAETDAEGYVGLVGGLILLVASITALVGLVQGTPWAPKLLGVTGLTVAVGFVLYHALPFHSPATNPYFGEDKIWLAQCTPVVLCVVIGLWAAWETLRPEPASTAHA